MAERYSNPDSEMTTQTGSGPVRFEIISYRGEIFGPYPTMEEAARAAKEKWPDQEQDEERSGRGWDVQIAGLRDPDVPGSSA